MGNIKPLASLSAGLLARKGATFRESRQPVLTVHRYQDALIRAFEGEDEPLDESISGLIPGSVSGNNAGIVDGIANDLHDLPSSVDASGLTVVVAPDVTRGLSTTLPPLSLKLSLKEHRLSTIVLASVPDEQAPSAVSQAALPSLMSMGRRSALSQGRRAAFTLRLDMTRHAHLRQISKLSGRSAQMLLTEALDTLLQGHPHETPHIEDCFYSDMLRSNEGRHR